MRASSFALSRNIERSHRPAKGGSQTKQQFLYAVRNIPWYSVALPLAFVQGNTVPLETRHPLAATRCLYKEET